MSPMFEQILVLVVMSIVVSLFTWIYVSDRRREFRLWLFGWIAICVHFAVPVVARFLPLQRPVTVWISRVGLIVAGTFFLLSVSFRSRRQRVIFVTGIASATVVYLSALIGGLTWAWLYIGLIMASTFSGVYLAIRYYGLRSLYMYWTSCVLVPYAAWTVWKTTQGDIRSGMSFYLFALFYVTGLAYFRYFRRLTPGVIFTSASFILWGLVFPVGGYLVEVRHFTALGTGFFWDLPKYFVAFGMILTLFENQTQVATRVAAQYQGLFEGNMAAVYVSAFDGKLLNCNSAFVEMYGFASKAEALSTPAALNYEDPAARAAFIEKLNQEGHVLNHESRQLRKDGTPLWILERATVVSTPDGRRVIESTAIEITERKQAELAVRQSEERFAAIFRENPIPCGIVSLDGVFIDVNEGFVQVVALPAEKIIGRSAVQLGLWNSQLQREQFYERLRAEGAIHNLEVEFKDAKGRRHEGLYFAVLVGIGEKQCIFGMMLDQTDQRELEARFLQAQKMESLGRLAGGVAHDFNNLLGVIGGYAELLEAKLGQTELYRRYCSKIIETTQRASGLTRQLLTFSRKEVTRPMPLRPDQAFRELSGILPRLIGEDIELSMKLSSSGTVIIDKTHFEQIVFNVVINSRDAMPKGGLLAIETEDIFRPSLLSSGNVTITQHVAIRITDNGSGMSDDTRQHAFEPFYTTKEPGRGTGLGLATVYGIVQQCMGEVTIDSQVGKGTQITIFLPAMGDLQNADHSGMGEEVKKGSGNILLVEDEPDLRGASAEFLSAMGYSVICASSGPEALKLAREAGPIDLVISDMVMPRMNGREFADHLLRELPNIKLLFVSGYADNDVLHNGNGSQPVPFLQKPFSLKQLGSKVNELLSITRSL